jgi:hypothetical protein
MAELADFFAPRADSLFADRPPIPIFSQIAIPMPVVLATVRLLADQHGNVTFAHLLSRLRCAKCRGKPRAVFLCAGQRQATGGPPPDWAIELVSLGR